MKAIRVGHNGAIASLAGFLGLVLLVGPSMALAVGCGDEILPGGSVRIDDNIGPCAESPALTIEGPVNVNFNGFTLECAGAGTGIEIQGQNAKVQNGKVLNCEDGIDVRGDGGHKILKMIVTSAPEQDEIGDRGLRVRSNDNHLVQNIVKGFNGEGFRVEGKRNRLVNNEARSNSGHGFRLDGNGEHELVNNLAEGNGQEGFRLDDDGNYLVNNVAKVNGDEGFRTRNGKGNTIINNRAEMNGATDNEAGFRIQTSENLLRKNSAISNCGNGILLRESAKNNEIAHNTAFDNGAVLDNGESICEVEIVDEEEYYDLVDENVDCDDNTWFKNRYDTRNQDCID